MRNILLKGPQPWKKGLSAKGEASIICPSETAPGGEDPDKHRYSQKDDTGMRGERKHCNDH